MAGHEQKDYIEPDPIDRVAFAAQLFRAGVIVSHKSWEGMTDDQIRAVMGYHTLGYPAGMFGHISYNTDVQEGITSTILAADAGAVERMDLEGLFGQFTGGDYEV